MVAFVFWHLPLRLKVWWIRAAAWLSPRVPHRHRWMGYEVWIDGTQLVPFGWYCAMCGKKREEAS